MVELLFSVQLKAFHHFRGKVIIIMGVHFGSDAQQFPHRKIKMLGKVFDIADPGIHGGCGYGLAVHPNHAVRNVLIPGDGFEERGFPRAISAQQAIDPGLVHRKGNVFEYGCLPIPLGHLFEFYHAAIPP